METNQLKRALRKIQKRTIQALLYISEDQFDIAKSPIFTCFKIMIYFWQLEGYIYSQYESKPLTLPENIYLSNFTQLAPSTFILLQAGIDVLTQIFFFLIFSIHCCVYIILIRMSLDSEIARPSYLKKALNLFFINYQWMFVTPFQEISIGVIVCGKNSFLRENQWSPTCYQDKNKIFYIFGILGTFFVSLSGFSISYFFRNYSFYDKSFSRQFSYTNVFRIIIHQLVIILYYLDFQNVNYVKHSFQQFLGYLLILDIIKNQPFGYSFESQFYTSASFTHQYMITLTAIWIFSPGLTDTFFFYTLLLITPLIIILSIQLLKGDQISICNNFEITIFNKRADKYLEEIYRTAEESDTNIESKILFIQILNHHIKLCKDLKCPCTLNVQKYFSNTSVEYQQLNEFSTYTFEKCLNLTLQNKNSKYYEYLSLKYVTFLAKYKNNPVNAFTILQTIMNNQQEQSKTVNNKQTQKSSFYFMNIQFILQKRNRYIFQNRNQHHQKSLKLILKGQSIIENIGIHVVQQLKELIVILQLFWENYMNNQIYSFQLLSIRIKNIQKQIHITDIYFQVLRRKIEQGFQIDCLSILNLELLFKLCSSNNVFELYEIQKKIQTISLIEQQDQESFLNIHFQNKQIISIISNITQQKRGEIWKPNQKLFEEYFDIDYEIQYINQLMPSFISDIHDGIIENFIRTGNGYKMESITQIFSITKNRLLLPIQFTIDYFFPKIDKDYQFYIIAFLKRIENRQSQDKNNIGYMYIDQNLNILNINQQILQKLSNNQQIDCSKLELCYILPSLVDSLILQYKFMLEKQIDFIDNEIFISKQQETFYVATQQGKIFNINLNNNIKNKITQLEDISEDLQSTSFSQFKQYNVTYQLQFKRLTYVNDSNLQTKSFFLLKIQFSDEEKQDIKKDDDHQNQNSQDLTLQSSFNIQQNFFEGSQRSKSSNQTMLQQSNSFHESLINNNNNKMITILIFINFSFLIFFILTFITICVLCLIKFKQSNYCIDLQNNISQDIWIYSSLINLYNNQQFYNDITINPVNINNTIIPIQQILDIIINISQFLSNHLITTMNIDISYKNTTSDIILQYVDNIFSQKVEQQIDDILTLRQIISASAQSYLNSQNIKEFSIIITNFRNLITLLDQRINICYLDFQEQINLITNSSTSIIISIYIVFLILYMIQLLILNKQIRQMKLILKLFTRTDYIDAFQENNKFQIMQNFFRSCETIWLQEYSSQLYHQINQKQFKDEYQLSSRRSERTRNEKKIEITDTAKYKISINHQFSNIISILILSGITILSFIYILSFHIQIVNSSAVLNSFITFSQNLQQYQYSYNYQYSNCQFHLLSLFYNQSQNISDYKLYKLMYLLNEEDNNNLEQDIGKLNSNQYNTLLFQLFNQNSNINNILQLNNDQLELLYQGYFCQLDVDICNIDSGRVIGYEVQLIDYFSQSLHQQILIQGQIFSQNNEIFNLTNQNDIWQSLNIILENQDYFINNLWGYDIIQQRISNSILYLLNLSIEQLNQQGFQLFLYALIIGLIYFIISFIILIIFQVYFKRQTQSIRYSLLLVPFSTIIKKKINEQLKLIE